MDERKKIGKSKKDVFFPVPSPESEMDTPYFELRDLIVTRIKETRLRFVVQANTAMIELYWNIGNDILRRQESEGWGAKVIDRLSADLKKEFPEMSGFSPRNLKYMRKFAESWVDLSIVQQPVAQLQWRSIFDYIQGFATRFFVLTLTICKNAMSFCTKNGMKRFASIWTDPQILQRPVAKL
jgi:hypothetical protein